MRSVALLSVLSGLAAASPRPQVINVDAIDDLVTPSVLGPTLAATTADPVKYNPTSAASVAAAEIPTAPAEVKRDITKRTACAPQPNDGYVESFKNLQGSTQQIGYLTYKTLKSYDVDVCRAFCDSVKFCVGFNIYFERDPTVDAAAACPNPLPTTNIKCSLYGYPVAKESATNTGQWRGPADANRKTFHVVIAGSNRYSKLAPCPSPASYTNFTSPSRLLHGAINASLAADGSDTYLGIKLYNNGPYDPSQCAAACQAQTAYDGSTAASDGSYKPCNFFNSYILAKNNVPQGTYCSFYTQTWDASYVVNTGYNYGSDVYAVWASFTYSLTAPDPGHL
ncbi:hypothetical protein BDV96DRAFT_662375 [Lophiotrema nucula]|uniref:Apple domain-containing protein n=1 Tax=Lophiotrema nucula TaxID=690887 RepID=A0A6A5Z1P7_9PLEO|nr:hypothetical protein BDV96DRAFT_662375 [Lophiotrema nucula]